MRLRLPLHGRSHRARGADPIWPGDPWLFNTDNEGGWGYVQFNDDFDLDLLPDPLSVGGTWGGAIEDGSGSGLLIGSTGQLMFKTTGSGVNTETNGGGYGIATLGGGYSVDTSVVAGTGGGYSIVTGGGGVTFDTQDGGFTITTGAGTMLLGTNNEIEVNEGTGQITLYAASDDTRVQTNNGKKFKVLDHNGNPIFEVRDDGTIHIKTGQTIQADL